MASGELSHTALKTPGETREDQGEPSALTLGGRLHTLGPESPLLLQWEPPGGQVQLA